MSVEERVKELIEPILESMDLSLFEIEYKRGNPGVLRVFIERKDKTSPTIGECEKVSGILSIQLDNEDFIDHRYYLEVSSPGVERKLRNREDFLDYIGNRIRVVLTKKLGKFKKFTGILKDVKDDIFIVDINGKEFQIPFELLKTAHLKFTTEEIFKMAKDKKGE